MTWSGRWAWRGLLACAATVLAAGASLAEVLTVDRAVEMALKHNADVINAEAGVLEGRSGLYSAYGGILPTITAAYGHSEQLVQDRFGSQAFGTFQFRNDVFREFDKSLTPQLSVSGNILNLSSWAGLISARRGMREAQHLREAARNDVVLAARSAFYNVVQAIRLADVASGALRLAQDDERRVRALFEVGSVSKSDLLKAQVRTAQSQLDSLTAGHTVIRQRIALAKLVGVQETQLGEVDTVLTAAPREYDEAQILSEAARSRPDLRAAAAELAAARAGLLSSRLSRLPALVGSGSVNFATRSEFDQRAPDYDALSGAFLGIVEGNGKTETHRVWGANVALRWNIFDGLLADSRTASSRARLLRAEEGYAALRRNLEGEVRDAMQTYREAVERETVARRALESAQEDLKLSQEKYNVGSATILELIDAQVQLQRAQSDLVSALAAIRVAEAQVERVRGSAK